MLSRFPGSEVPAVVMLTFEGHATTRFLLVWAVCNDHYGHVDIIACVAVKDLIWVDVLTVT